MLNITRLVSRELFASSRSQLLNKSYKRNIRVKPRIIRTKLPKYKINLNSLPPLTGLLTSNNQYIGKESLDELRQKKLDVYKSYVPVNSNTNLLEALFRSDNNINDLLRLIDDNLYTMSSFYIGISFELLDDMMQSKQCEIETVMVAPEFRSLCNRTLYKLRFFEADEILKLVKCLSTLSVPEDSLILQGALQMCRHLINDFEIRELEALEESLSKIEAIEEDKSSLLLSTLAIIPLVKEKHLKEKLLPIDHMLLQDSSKSEDVK